MTLPAYIPSFLKFCKILEQRGFLLPGDRTHLYRALELVDLRQRKEVYLALKTVLLLEPEREEEFRQIFETFFSYLPVFPKPRRSPLSEEEPGEMENSDDALSLWEYLRGLSLSMGLTQGKIPLGEGYARYKLWKKLEEEGILSSLTSSLGEDAPHFLKELRRFVEEFVYEELRYRELSEIGPLEKSDIYERSFYHITPDELPRILREVERIAQRLKHLYGRRRTRGNTGKIHLSRTMRRNLKNNGLLFDLQFQKPRIQKFDLLIFVDVSASVRTASSFMLTFSYAFHELFQRVRSFAFVTRCVEITDLMKRNPLRQVIQEILEGKVLDVWEDSDYGAFLNSIHEVLPDMITPRTTVLILGDARSNYRDPRSEYLEELSLRSHSLLWFNPEPPGSWGFGDSVIHTYAPHCTIVAPVGNLRMLIEAVDRHLIPRVIKKRTRHYYTQVQG